MNHYRREDEEDGASYSPLLARLAQARAERERQEPTARAEDAAVSDEGEPPLASTQPSVSRFARALEAAMPEDTGEPDGHDELDCLRRHACGAGDEPEGSDEAVAPVVRSEARPAAVQQARAEIERLRAQMEQARAALLTARRRGERDKADSLRFAAGDTIAQLLPIVDDFERAVAHVPAALRDDPWVAGVMMIGSGLRDMLERQGVERISPRHAPFDPHCHEAVARIEDSTVPENTIVEVYRPGYILHGRVLRPAQVRVAVRGEQ